MKSSNESEIVEVDSGDTYNNLLARLEFLCNANSTIDSNSWYTLSTNENSTNCPKVFDGYLCWEETLGGSIVYADCPSFIFGFDPLRKAHKECLEDGTWFIHPESNKTWTNYTNCVNLDDFHVRFVLHSIYYLEFPYQSQEDYILCYSYRQWRVKNELIVTIYEIGYLISILALVISLVIFGCFKSLQCTRVLIHKHLFFSFIISNILFLIWHFIVAHDVNILHGINQTFCTTIRLLAQYFLVANYFWMFCEGFYIHKKIVYVFNQGEKKILRCFFGFGWIGPIVPVGLYAIFRFINNHDDQFYYDEIGISCWIVDSIYINIIVLPVGITLLASLGLLINILRVVIINSFVDTRSGNGKNLVQAAKTIFILTPLLGVHFLLIPLRPDPNSSYAFFYECFPAVSASFQGLVVSIIFCFCDGEVLKALRNKFPLAGLTSMTVTNTGSGQTSSDQK